MLENEIRDKVAEGHEGKRKTEALWPVHQINWQRSRYVFDMHYKYKKIDKETYEYCVRNKLVDAALIAKWKKPGYERLCATYVINTRNYKFGTTSICRVPKHALGPDASVEDPTTGCRGCASGPGGQRNIFGNKYGQYLAAIQVAREEERTRREEIKKLKEELHFSNELMESIARKGIEISYVTLHVGSGTFKPVRAEQIEEHEMHSEWFNIPKETSNSIQEAKSNGRRVICIGTTSLRALESAWNGKQVVEGWAETDIFIYPGYQFNVVDALLTNFHLPKSTLMMLVSAFAGKKRIFDAYDEAIREGYRFFSYGDAMFLGEDICSP